MDERSSPLAPEDFLAHAEHLRALARRLVRDDAEADDLVQETWLTALERKRTDIPERGWRPWLAGTLKNLVREKRRGEGRRVRRERDSARAEATTTEDVVEKLETFQLLARELSALDEPYRSALYERFFAGRPNVEIAAREGLAEATVRSRHMRGLELLRERLDRRFRGDRSAWCVLLARIGDIDPAPAATVGSKVILAAILFLGVGLGVWTIVALHAPEMPLQVAHVPLVGSDPERQVDSALKPPISAESITPPAVTAEPKAANATSATAPRKGKPVLRIVDERTGEPLPDYGIVVWSATSEKLALISDEHGLIACPKEIEEGSISVELVDEPMNMAPKRNASGRSFPWAIPLEFHPGRGAIDVRVAVGPTFFFDLRGPDRAIAAVNSVALFASDRGGAMSLTGANIRRPHRQSELPWARLPVEGSFPSGPPPYILRVAAPDATWIGEVLVSNLIGTQREPLVVELEARTCQQVLVVDEHGRPIDAHVELLQHDISVRHSDGLHHTFNGIVPGSIRLRARSLGRTEVVRDISVAPEVSQPNSEPIVLELVPLPDSVHVRGRISSANATELGQVWVTLRDLETNVEAQTTARIVGKDLVFSFDAAPPHACEVRAQMPGLARWNPQRLIVHPPADDIVLTARESGPVRQQLKFRAFDAETGARVDRFAVDVGIDPADDKTTRQWTTFGNTNFDRIPLDAELAWAVIAEGYVTARGDARSIEVEGDHEMVRVELVRGWQRDIVVSDAKTWQPLERARVLVDGVEVGRTDAHGTLRVTRAAAPNRIGVELDGWRVVPVQDGGIDPVSGRYTSEDALRIVVRLEQVH